MFGATNSLALNYRLNDTGITGNGVTTVGSTGSPFDHFNAGINTSGGTELLIEDANAPGSQEVFVSYTDRYENFGTKNKDFSKVDNDLVSNKTYRKYSTTFRTGSSNKLCDLV